MSTETSQILKHWRDAIPDDRLAHLVKDATRALVRSLQNRLADHDVSFGHWTYLRVLWERDGITQRELAAEAGVMESTTATAVREMEKKGYITRRHLAENKRKQHLFLTPLGETLKTELVPLAEEVNRIAVQGIASDDIARMRESLLTMIENLAADDA